MLENRRTILGLAYAFLNIFMCFCLKAALSEACVLCEGVLLTHIALCRGVLRCTHRVLWTPSLAVDTGHLIWSSYLWRLAAITGDIRSWGQFDRNPPIVSNDVHRLQAEMWNNMSLMAGYDYKWKPYQSKRDCLLWTSWDVMLTQVLSKSVHWFGITCVNK